MIYENELDVLQNFVNMIEFIEENALLYTVRVKLFHKLLSVSRSVVSHATLT